MATRVQLFANLYELAEHLRPADHQAYVYGDVSSFTRSWQRFVATHWAVLGSQSAAAASTVYVWRDDVTLAATSVGSPSSSGPSSSAGSGGNSGGVTPARVVGTSASSSSSSSSSPSAAPLARHTSSASSSSSATASSLVSTPSLALVSRPPNSSLHLGLSGSSSLLSSSALMATSLSSSVRSAALVGVEAVSAGRVGLAGQHLVSNYPSPIRASDMFGSLLPFPAITLSPSRISHEESIADDESRSLTHSSH